MTIFFGKNSYLTKHVVMDFIQRNRQNLHVKSRIIQFGVKKTILTKMKTKIATRSMHDRTCFLTYTRMYLGLEITNKNVNGSIFCHKRLSENKYLWQDITACYVTCQTKGFHPGVGHIFSGQKPIILLGKPI